MWPSVYIISLRDNNDDTKKQRYWEIGDGERIIVVAKSRSVEWGRTREVY